MKESRATSSFLPSGLSPSAPDYGSLSRAFTGSTSGPSRRVAGSPKRAFSSGSPPVREFHPPPKVTSAKLPHPHRSNKEAISISACQHFSFPQSGASQVTLREAAPDTSARGTRFGRRTYAASRRFLLTR